MSNSSHVLATEAMAFTLLLSSWRAEAHLPLYVFSSATVLPAAQALVAGLPVELAGLVVLMISIQSRSGGECVPSPRNSMVFVESALKPSRVIFDCPIACQLA